MCRLQYDDLESSLRDSGVLVRTQKTEHLEVRQKTKIINERLSNIELLENQKHTAKPQTSA